MNPIKYTDYFERPAAEWSFISFYQHHSTEQNFSSSFIKESFLLKRALEFFSEIPEAKLLAEKFWVCSDLFDTGQYGIPVKLLAASATTRTCFAPLSSYDLRDRCGVQESQ
jgi:hypothetical protein